MSLPELSAQLASGLIDHLRHKLEQHDIRVMRFNGQISRALKRAAGFKIDRATYLMRFHERTMHDVTQLYVYYRLVHGNGTKPLTLPDGELSIQPATTGNPVKLATDDDIALELEHKYPHLVDEIVITTRQIDLEAIQRHAKELADIATIRFSEPAFVIQPHGSKHSLSVPLSQLPDNVGINQAG